MWKSLPNFCVKYWKNCSAYRWRNMVTYGIFHYIIAVRSYCIIEKVVVCQCGQYTLYINYNIFPGFLVNLTVDLSVLSTYCKSPSVISSQGDTFTVELIDWRRFCTMELKCCNSHWKWLHFEKSDYTLYRIPCALCEAHKHNTLKKVKSKILFLNFFFPLFVCFLFFAFLGLMPYNFICCQTGCILSQLTSLDELFTFNVVIKLCGIAVMALLPGLIVKKLHKAKKSHSDWLDCCNFFKNFMKIIF